MSDANLERLQLAKRAVRDVDFARQHEAERWLGFLGEAKQDGSDYRRIGDRARAVGVSVAIFAERLAAYRKRGLEGLKPDWEPLDEKDQQAVLESYRLLGEYADAETTSKEDIDGLATRNGWKRGKARAWLRRYRIGGLYALAKKKNPEKRPRKKSPRRDLGSLSEHQLEVACERLMLLGDLAKKSRVSNAEFEERSQELGGAVCPRTLRTFWSANKEGGLASLAPQERSDRGKVHNLSDRMVEIIKGIRLSKPDASVRHVRKEATRIAKLIGESPPGPDQVRRICSSIPETDRLIADGRRNEFRNKGRITFPGEVGDKEYELDCAQVNVITIDKRSPRFRKVAGIAPWLTAIMHTKTRVIVAARFTYDVPNRFDIAATIRDALLPSAEHPYGGLPDRIIMDRGKVMLANYVYQFLEEQGIDPYYCYPHYPEGKPHIESFFGTVETEVWVDTAGYRGRNVVERNPNVKPKLTLVELEARFWSFIADYHNRVHSETRRAPAEYWAESTFLLPADPRQLDILLMEPADRKISKEGISYRGRTFWHPAFADFIGIQVLIRAGPSYAVPDEIQVFHEGRWLCTAFATDSEMGELVTHEQVAAAQREQSAVIRGRINAARRAVADAEREGGTNGGTTVTEQQQKPPSSVREKPEPARRATTTKRSRNVLRHKAGLDR